MKDFTKARKQLIKQKYGLFGNHSAVQVCHWTKSSLRGKSGCWKEKFYGIDSHRCCQMSVSLFNCENKCLHCWRNTENTEGDGVINPEKPKEILEGLIAERRKLMNGFPGNSKVDKKKLPEAFNPNLFTLSLTGEATLYPRLPELIREIRNRKSVSFLVTNGQNPEMIKKLEKENSLPTQLTISTNAPNKELFEKWHNSLRKDGWERFNETLDVMKKLDGKVRKVIRLTLVKKGKDEKNPLNNLENMSDENVLEYVNLIKKAQPDFIHVKGFMSIGYSRPRGMTYDKQPWFKDVKDYAKKLVKEMHKQGMKKYKILAEEKRSNVVMISRLKKSEIKIRNV